MKTQYSLRSLAILLTLAPLLFSFLVVFGPVSVALVAVPIGCLWAWALLYRLAPIATKFFTTIAVFALLLFSLASMKLLRDRERARRNFYRQVMRETYTDYQLNPRKLRAPFHRQGVAPPFLSKNRQSD